MSQYERNLELLNKRRIVYRRDPITDIPDIENNMYMFLKTALINATICLKALQR